jgi:putative transcriptional regulator
MKDPFFSRSVVYVCEHNANGAMGLIINKKLNDSDLNKVFNKLSTIDESSILPSSALYFGGPVMLESRIIIHHSSYSSPDSLLLSKSISITNRQDILKSLKKVENIPFKLMLGHSGWSGGQLEREIENGDWLIQDTTSDFVFNLPSEQMWEHAARSLGIDLGPFHSASAQT